MRISWPDKYPGESVVFAVDWTTRLNGATITTQVFTVLNGDVTIAASGFDGAISWCRITGGTGTAIQEVLSQITLSDAARPLQEIAEFRMLAVPE